MKKYHYMVLVLVLLVAPIVNAEGDEGQDPGFFGKLFKTEDRKIDTVREVRDIKERRDNTQLSSETPTITGVRNDMRINKAVTELDRRIGSLQKLQTRIEAMTRISDASKASLKATLSSEIAALLTLKAKITASTDEVTLKADMSSITKTYRIYALILPQMTILAAGDKIATTVELMITFGAKLETRIAAAKTAGKDVVVLEAAFTDFKTQLSEAKANADAAVALTVNLKPDNGDKALMESNKKALSDARAKIRAGQADLKVARKDLEIIIKGLKALNGTGDTKIQAEKTKEIETEN